MFSFTPTLCAAACAALIAPAFAAEWMTDFEAAKARATAENKAILVDFTGSDWCGPCMHLRKTVLDTPAFEAYARDKFVLLEVDMPRREDFDPELRKHNQELCARYRVGGFPTIMVLSPEGLPAGGFVGGGMSLERATAALDAALANVPAAQTAERLEGEQKLRALHALSKSMPEELAASLRARLAELDTGNITGIQDDIRAEKQLEDFRQMLYDAARQKKDARATIALVDEALRSAAPQNRVHMLMARMNLQIKCADSIDEVKAIHQTMLDMAKADPANAQRIREIADERFGNPELVLRALRLSRESLEKERQERERQKNKQAD